MHKFQSSRPSAGKRAAAAATSETGTICAFNGRSGNQFGGVPHAEVVAAARRSVATKTRRDETKRDGSAGWPITAANQATN
jgi:hypothetical protein